MSRGFVKESDQEPAPFVPPRAVLPKGATNYVTARGLRLLHEEREGLEQRRAALGDATTDDEARRELGVITTQLNRLDARIASARLVEPEDVDTEEARFGATVTYKMAGARESVTVTIVGVDEADFKNGRVSFLSPLAKALYGKRAGEKAVMDMGNGGARRLVVEGVGYAPTPPPAQRKTPTSPPAPR